MHKYVLTFEVELDGDDCPRAIEDAESEMGQQIYHAFYAWDYQGEVSVSGPAPKKVL